jgi:hypothetical protein
MDKDITELNRLFMLKIREYAHLGEEHKARYLLGASSDVIHLIKNLSISQIQALADSNATSFSLRIPASLLKEFQFDGYSEREEQSYRTHILASLTQQRRGGLL